MIRHSIRRGLQFLVVVAMAVDGSEPSRPEVVGKERVGVLAAGETGNTICGILYQESPWYRMIPNGARDEIATNREVAERLFA
jgi:hypothetical protein